MSLKRIQLWFHTHGRCVMNRLCFVLGLCLVSYSLARAQTVNQKSYFQPEVYTVNYKNSIRIGADYATLNSPTNAGIRYLIRYSRHLVNDRIVLESSLGFLEIPADIHSLYRHRITGDITVLYDLLKNSSHALRLGGGGSAWYRREGNSPQTINLIDSSGRIIVSAITQERVSETNFGYHAVAEYEYLTALGISLSSRVGFVGLNKVGINPTFGLNIGYRF